MVDAVGPGTGVTVGDEVLGWAMLASYAEHVVTEAGSIVPKPAALPWPHAGVLSASGQTAATALELLSVGSDDTVLVHAAAGGVGSFAVQLAVLAGARVIGTASAGNHDYLRSLGADPVEYGDGLTDRVHALAPDGVHVALDASGTVEALQASIELVGDKDRIGTVAFQPAADQLGVRRLSTQRSTERLRRLTEFYDEGQLAVSIQHAYPLQAAADAHRAIDTGHVRGKIVLTT